MATTWTISIDWNRDGTYTDETSRVIAARWFIGFQQPYMDVASDSQLVLTVRNDDKRFSPEYSSGALYGKLVPLRPVKIESNDGTHPTTDQFSQAQFKTMKYRPDYPDRFANLDRARLWVRQFVDWYNCQHYHSGLNLMTPASVHYGEADAVQQQRQVVMWAAYEAHPNRFAQGEPVVRGVPGAVYINPPTSEVNLL